MNIPRYLYSENVKSDFLCFLKDANEAKSDTYCNFKKYEQMINLFPLDSKIKKDLKTYMENANICIDITQSDDEAEHNNRELFKKKDNDPSLDKVGSIEPNSFQDLELVNISDIIDSIKDSLYVKNEITKVIKDLSNLDNDNLDKVFSSLSVCLSLEDIENFCNSVMDSNNNNDYVILSYVKYFFLPRAMQEFTYEIETVFLSISQKYEIVIKSEVVREFLTIDNMERNRVLLQYVGILKNDFKTDLLRQFIYKCEKLHPSYILIIEALLNPQNDFDILSKLIQVMSNAVVEFINDNAYGKLLFNVVNLLERNVSRLEQPLKHILGIHRSIWKIKVQKIVINSFDDSLTQSFV